MKLLALVLVFFVANVHEILTAPAATYDQQQTGHLNVRVDLENISIVALLGGDYLGNFGSDDYSYDYADFTLKPITPQATASAPAGATGSSSTTVKPWHSWPTISGVASTPTVSLVPAENLSSVSAEHVTVDSLQSESEYAKPESVNAKPESEIAKPESENAKLSTEVADGTASVNASDETRSALAEPQAAPTTATIRAIDRTGLADKPLSEKDPVAATIPAAAELQASFTEENPPSSTVTGNSEASTDQTQAQPLRKCSPGYARDQKGRCSRLHTRRRIPVSLLPFGIRLTPRIHRHKDQQSEAVDN